jgi:hypothetical protein
MQRQALRAGPRRRRSHLDCGITSGLDRPEVDGDHAVIAEDRGTAHRQVCQHLRRRYGQATFPRHDRETLDVAPPAGTSIASERSASIVVGSRLFDFAAPRTRLWAEQRPPRLAAGHRNRNRCPPKSPDAWAARNFYGACVDQDVRWPRMLPLVQPRSTFPPRSAPLFDAVATAGADRSQLAQN